MMLYIFRPFEDEYRSIFIIRWMFSVRVCVCVVYGCVWGFQYVLLSCFIPAAKDNQDLSDKMTSCLIIMVHMVYFKTKDLQYLYVRWSSVTPLYIYIVIPWSFQEKIFFFFFLFFCLSMSIDPGGKGKFIAIWPFWGEMTQIKTLPCDTVLKLAFLN